MTSDRDFGINTLRFYANVGFVTLGNLVARLDEIKDASGVPYAVETIGKLARSMSQDKARDAMEKLAKYKGMSYPSRAELNSALLEAGAAMPSALSLIGDGLADSVDHLKNGLVFGLSVTTVIVVGAAAYLLLTESGRKQLRAILPIVGAMK